MIIRDAEPTLKQLAQGYPVLTITGPRQSGKSTLARTVFPNHPYVTLENPDQREFVQQDPRGFLHQYREGAIIDEAQRCPELFSWLQGVVDEYKRPAHFILTGSQQFGLLAGITQSLAGRVALLNLLPFTSAELRRTKQLPNGIDKTLYMGSYPPIFDRHLDPSTWYANYAQTYLERDVRQLIHLRDLSQFQRFLRLCAGRTGQLLNLTALGEEAGISHNTAREWISVLEASYIIHRLPPYHRNFNKRLVKTPKLYFIDTGLAVWLLGIESAQQLSTHPLRGALFETWIVAEHLKARFNIARPSNLSFWRDRSGYEIDLLIEQAGQLLPIEIKSGSTVSRDALRSLEKWRAIPGQEQAQLKLIYGGDATQKRSDVDLVSWQGSFLK